MLARLRVAPVTRRWISAAFSQSRLSSRWSFVSGLVSLPHPEKERGEDAAFVSKSAVGVADGVGGWARKGIDSGAYSRLLMESCAASASPDPVERLTEAYASTKVPGSSTACLVHIEESKPELITANLGDSGFLVCRREEDKWTLVYASPSQCHYFNCPLQLGHGSRDTPEHADKKTIPVDANDLVIVATDGLFDNLFEEEILAILGMISNDPAAQGQDLEAQMQFTASALVEVAHEVAKLESRMTPFAVAARKAGYKGTTGGKMDDITVVAATVTETQQV